jgi:Ca-activated chloride channel family protein
MSTDIELIDLDEVAGRPTDDDGLGCLHTKRGNLPLESIDVRTRITGLASHTELTQGFRNTHDEPLEATYIFPLPPRAAVTAMRMEADGRVVEGLLQERGEARANYDQAIKEGKRASIAEEERPGVFTMRVGNIVPGERVTVHLTLAGALSYEDGEATFRFPLVVAPRYIPGTPLEGEQVGDGTAEDTNAVPDASRISPPVLLPGFPNPVRLSLEVEVDAAGLPLSGVRSSLHATATEDTPNGMRIRLNPGERADRDFLLRLRLGADDAVSTALAVLTDEDEQGGTFALTLLPPANEPPRRGRAVVLVLDRSGSMDGWKMVAARRAAARIVDTLSSDDRFAVLAFDFETETPPGLPETLAEATDRNRFRAVEFLAGLNARGGTEMLSPLRRATKLLREVADRERVLVLVTDGQIGNEDQILSELTPTLAGVRVHTVGIDRSVNEGFLQRLAGSHGRCELVESEDRLDEAMHNIHRRIGTPLVTELQVRQDGLAVDLTTLAPAPLPDLYPGAPVVVMGRFTGSAEGTVLVSGQPDWRTSVPATRSTNPALPALWARANIRDLEDQYVTGQTSLEERIIDTSLRFGVLSRFTAFVAVDQRVVNEGGTTRRVTQPVDLPSGWEVPGVPVAGAVTMQASMPTFGAMSRFSAAESTRGAQGSYDGLPPQQGSASLQAGPSAPGGGYGGWQSGNDYDSVVAAEDEESGWASPVAPPPSRPTPPPASAGAGSLAKFVTDELARLRDSTGHEVWVRAGLLAALAERIRVQLTTWQQNKEPAQARKTLGTLSTELAAASTADPAEVERLWQKTITTLESLLSGDSPRGRRAFWKR